MTTICPECGAILNEDTSCQSIFDSFLVLEFTDPGYGKVHMLTVACFMIQHGRYSDEGYTWIEQQLRAYLQDGVPIEYIRRRAAKNADQNVRAWKVTRQPGASPLPKITWSMTIADVASNYHDAPSYCDLIKKWAHLTLHEMGPFLSKP